jgi:DNA-binding response OmpR family regulator
MARILLLETDKFVANNVSRMLEVNGHRVDWQVDPQEAIISIDLQPVDLIITELVLAGRSGIEFLYELRSYTDWQKLPVIIFTNVPAREVGLSAQGFEQLNIEAYYHKNRVSVEALLGTVRNCLSAAAA